MRIVLFLSDEGPMLETLLYSRQYYPYWQYTDLFIFRLYLYSAYAAHYVYF